MWDQSLRELFLRGGPVMWPLLAASIIGLALMLDRAIAFVGAYQNFDGFLRALRPAILAQDWAGTEKLCRGRGPLSRLAMVYLQHRHLPEKVREDVLQREGAILLGGLEKRVRWLAINGQLSPMLGLLGTVTGLVAAFHQVELQGGQVQPSHLAAGIWEALLTTVFGLVIAIPCLTVSHACESRLDSIGRQFALMVSYLDQWCLESSLVPSPLSLAPDSLAQNNTNDAKNNGHETKDKGQRTKDKGR